MKKMCAYPAKIRRRRKKGVHIDVSYNHNESNLQKLARVRRYKI